MKKIYYLISLILGIGFSAASQNTVGTLLNSSLALNGYTLISSVNASDVYLVDNCGFIVNQWRSGIYKPGASVYLLEDGSLLKTGKLTTGNFITGGSGGKLERYDWNDSLIWEYTFDSPTERQHHDVTVMPSGNIMVLSWDLKTAAEAKAKGQDTTFYNRSVWSEKLVELQPLGRDSAHIVWEWYLWDHMVQDFDSNLSSYGIISQNPQLVDLNFSNNNGLGEDYFHINGIDYNPSLDQIVLSVRNYDEIWIIDHSTTTAEASGNIGGNSNMGGDLLYRWGNPEAYNSGTLADKKLFGQHNPNWIKPGFRDAGKIILFNNGYNDSNMVSKAQIINPPILANGTYAKVSGRAYFPDSAEWSYDLPVFVDFVSGVSRLENGNTLITSGPDGNLIELDSLDSVVWNYVSPLELNNSRASQGNSPSSNSMFKAIKYSTTYPAFNGKNLSPSIPIELNPMTSNCTIFNNSTTIAEHQEVLQSFYLMNNPVKSQLNISNNSPLNYNLKVYNLQGAEVYEKLHVGSNITIDCSNWNSGAYILVFNQDGKFTSKKLIKL